MNSSIMKYCNYSGIPGERQARSQNGLGGVIASVAKQSPAFKYDQLGDCFVAAAPRNDGLSSYEILNKRRTLSAVACATASADTLRVRATASTTYRTYAGWLRRPRYGSGVR